MRLALETGLVSATSTVFDYGCGRGADISRLGALGIACSGWDPAYRADAAREPADVVNLGYVVNVIESPPERLDALRSAWALTRRVLVVSARLTNEMGDAPWRPWQDGYLTGRHTFQKFYEQQELREWIDASLGVTSIPAAPGVFLVFRDGPLAQSYLATRIRRRITVPRVRVAKASAFETHRAALEPLMAFFAARGRLPEHDELGEAATPLIEAFRTIRKAFAAVEAATDSVQWQRISAERADDLLVYLALAKFQGRPALPALPEELQRDIRGLFPSYRAACDRADALLFSVGQQEQVNKACARASVGKLTSEALYLHSDALPGADPLVRVYEGCARAYVGSVEGANILKLHRQKPQVSYLSYPAFDTDAHPALAESLKVRFRGLQIEYRDYRDSANPFILHRKETFVGPDYPARDKFARLTKQEDAKGLLTLAPSHIGTRTGWNRVLELAGVQVRGHRLLRATPRPPRNRTEK